MTDFGPQLIGQTEKALQAILRRYLEGSGLDEPHWVGLRLAAQLPEGAGTDDLVRAIDERAHRDDASAVAASLARRGLVDGGHPAPLGREVLARIQGMIDATRIWEGLDPSDAAAAARVLAVVRARAEAVLAVQ